jgi:hypothetical protein
MKKNVGLMTRRQNPSFDGCSNGSRKNDHASSTTRRWPNR